MAQSQPKVPPVLISGAGPSGLMLAIWLTKYSVPFRLVDKAKEPYTTSRAIAMHARTLEYYRMLGLTDQLLSVGTRLERSVINLNGTRKGVLELVNAGQDLSYYPYVLSITQDEHEAVLVRHLESCGVKIERGVEVTELEFPDGDQKDKSVKAKLRSSRGDETEMVASYVIGCDGAHSGVRHATDISMEGGTYTRSFFVADVFFSGDLEAQGAVNICLAQSDFAIIMALPHKENRARIVGFVPEDGKELSDVTFEDCQPSVSKCMPRINVDEVRWFATYKVHHRCATSFQYGNRVFLCGDSAHLHSPLGGQGMNTGLGDVSNLAWKLATAWHADAASLNTRLSLSSAQKLLSTYSAERKPNAMELVHTTDRMFSTLVAQSWIGWLLRNVLLPYVFPIITSSPRLRRRYFPKLAQIGIEYSNSALSQGNSYWGGLAGHRLPWLEKPGGAAGEADNHLLLDGTGWQVHLFGTERMLPDGVQQSLQRRDIPIYTFPMTQAAKICGFIERSLYLIRPDGHIGLIVSSASEMETNLEKYLEEWGVCHIGSRE